MLGFDLLPLPGSLVRTPDGTCHIIACMSNNHVVCLIDATGKYHTTGIHGLQRLAEVDAPTELVALRDKMLAERATEARNGSDT
jgi:hypothetical protein